MSHSAQRHHLWAVVLAAGSGRRVAELTKASNGQSIPKQYSLVIGHPTLLDRALARAEAIVPRSQTVVVVAEAHRELWTSALADWPAENVIVQPEDRGTAVGVLLAFQHVLARDPRACLLFLPSDHFVSDEARLARSLEKAADVSHADTSRLLLLGMRCEAVDDEYGWILPTPDFRAVRGVVAFREKPPIAEAEALRRQGALLNTFMFAVSGDTLLALYTRALPNLLVKFEQSLRDRLRPAEDELTALYSALEPADFSRDVLEPTTDRLAVLTALRCGWADLGTPTRLALHVRRREEIDPAAPKASRQPPAPRPHAGPGVAAKW